MKSYPTLQIPESLLNLLKRITDSEPETSSTVSLEDCAKAAESLENGSKLAFVLLNSYTFETRPDLIY